MRTILSISLLLLLTIPFAGMYAWLLHEKKQVRKEVKERILAGLDEKALTLLVFSGQEAEEKLNWEHAGEFEYQGQKYDVVKRAEKGDSLYFWCWWDHKETGLDQQIESVLAGALGKDPVDQQRHFQLQYFFKNLFTPVYADSLLQGLHTIRLHPQTDRLLRYAEGLRIPPVPPPWVFSS